MKGLLKNIVGAVAPTLGTALGGPMGGMAANMIADVLGVPNTPKAIEKGIAEATPEQMLELKKAEQGKDSPSIDKMLDNEDEGEEDTTDQTDNVDNLRTLAGLNK